MADRADATGRSIPVDPTRRENDEIAAEFLGLLEDFFGPVASDVWQPILLAERVITERARDS